ncbi:MAG: glycosyltransferase [Clostridia bacterium]|nr:glycosyltransferase [Clostridia bacterium]
MLISIIIPCYNSEGTIEKVVEETMKTFQQMEGYECEMILVNDYSRDHTFEAIRRAAAKYKNVIGVNLAKNFGQHNAMMAALHYVHGEAVVGMDDDLQNHPDQIPQFLEKMEEGYDVVFGVFRQRKFNWFKNLTSSVSRHLLWAMTDQPKNIQMSSFWLARRYVVDKALEYTGSNVFLQFLFFRTTHNIVDIEVEHFEREVGTSNYNFRRGLKQFLSCLNYTAVPLRAATFFGTIFSGAGFVGALVVLIRKLIHPDIAMGWSSLMCAMMVFFGITFLMLGIIGEYIGKVILNINNTPQYVVRETVNEEINDKINHDVIRKDIETSGEQSNINNIV